MAGGVAVKPTFRKVWAVPLALVVLGGVGLVAALVGDGMLDTVSWLALGVPVLVILWAWRRRRL
jgi:hypothetical protein